MRGSAGFEEVGMSKNSGQAIGLHSLDSSNHSLCNVLRPLQAAIQPV
ncbi:hypothetical protein RISK_003572 [Rhodopirellula islandica]|uniref:Uncharacterized protein n=1 Tax=Rhodopirellula islandica TaxID=595434 RepID=A0A0J1BD49_RHOIS|nr:hypothetical protein RISK_003572 [Rhodopirellula islandica]